MNFYGIFELFEFWWFGAILDFLDFHGIFEFHEFSFELEFLAILSLMIFFRQKLDFQNSVLQAFSLI